jgi:hypothetical protein
MAKCPDAYRCEVAGCTGQCKALATVRPPIPLNLGPLPKRRFRDALLGLLFPPRPSEPDPDPLHAPLPLPPPATPVSNILEKDIPLSDTLTPPKPQPKPAMTPATQTANRTPPMQIVPTLFGGSFVMVIDGKLCAAAMTPKQLSTIVEEWAEGQYTAV